MQRWYICTLAFLFDQALTIVRIYIGPLNMESFILAEYGSGRGRDDCPGALMMGCTKSSLVMLVTRQRLTVQDYWERSRSENSALLPRGGAG